MKQLSLILSIIAVLLGGTVLYLQLKGNNAADHGVVTPGKNASTGNAPFSIAYFDTDSMQNNYLYFKDALAALKDKEEKMNEQLRVMERSKQKKIAEWQQRIKTSNNNISQAEEEAMNREYREMEERNAYTRQQLQQQMEVYKDEELMKVRKKIEDYLKDYNKSGKYSFIFSYVPTFMFYKDTIYDITGDLVNGLNERYKKETKAK